MKPVFINGFPVNDENKIFALLREAHGLPTVSPIKAMYPGVWPAVVGVDRPGKEFSVDFLFKNMSETEFSGVRRALNSAMLNGENDTPFNFVVANEAFLQIDHDKVFGVYDVVEEKTGKYYLKNAVTGAEHEITGGFSVNENMIFASEGGGNRCQNPRFYSSANLWTYSGTEGTQQYNDGARSWVEVSGDAGDIFYYRFATAVNKRVSVLFKAQVFSSLKVSIKNVNTGAIIATADLSSNAGEWTEYQIVGNTPASNVGNVDFVIEFNEYGLYTLTDICIQTTEIADGYSGSYFDGSSHRGNVWATSPDASESVKSTFDCTIPLCLAPITAAGSLHFKVIPPQVVYGTNSYYLFYSTTKSMYIQNGNLYFWSHGNGSLSYTLTADNYKNGFVIDLTWENRVTNLYINGALVSTNTMPVDLNFYYDLRLGNPVSFYFDKHGFNGWIGEIFILTAKLSAAAVASFYTEGLKFREIQTVCSEFKPTQENLAQFLAKFSVSGDWLFNRPYFKFLSIMATGETKNVNNPGDADAYPIFVIKPKATKAAGYGFLQRRFIGVKWSSTNPATRYPVELTGGGLNFTGYAQADFDDVRVYSDGVEVDRWTGDTITALKVWANLDFKAAQQFTLKTAITAGGTVSRIEVNEDTVGNMPAAGLLIIDNEVFSYETRNARLKLFSGVTRASRDTTAADHSAGAVVYWLQHDVYIYFNNSSLSARVNNEDYKPIFDLSSSTNSSWVFAQFGENDYLRAGQWTPFTSGALASWYSASGGLTINPWDVAGLQVGPTTQPVTDYARFILYNPCGLSGVNITSARKYRNGSSTGWSAQFDSSPDGVTYTIKSAITAPVNNSTWEAFNVNVNTLAGDKYFCLKVANTIAALTNGVEILDATAAISAPPSLFVGLQAQNYEINLTITNNTTGESMTVKTNFTFSGYVRIDTRERVIKVNDNVNALSSKTLSSNRKDWLRLTPGNNSLTFTDAGTTYLFIETIVSARFTE